MSIIKLFPILIYLTLSTVNGWSQDLVVFSSKDLSNPVINDFNKTILPQLSEVAKNTESNFKVIYLENGIPDEVKSLPAIFYVNYKTKSIYKSAYGSTQRIKMFILQSKVFESNFESFTKKDLFTSSINNFEQGINLKVTPLKGQKTIPNDTISQQILTGLKMGLSQFEFKKTHQFKNSNKQFFLNIYPYLSQDNVYYLSYEVFSQNNCHQPILKISDQPISNKNLIQGSMELAQKIDSLWNDIFEDTAHQDGLVIIPQSKKIKSWEELGYNFSQNKLDYRESNTQLPQGSFQLEKERLIIFTFAPPADAYSGIISDFGGKFKYSDHNFRGEFIASLNSLDSGDEDLNSSIIEEQFNIANHPTCKITFDTVINILNYNEPISIPAQLSFLGKEKIIQLQTTFTSGDNNINFWVNTDFILNISSFESLEKPHFEAPINEEVHVHITFKAHNLVD